MRRISVCILSLIFSLTPAMVEAGSDNGDPRIEQYKLNVFLDDDFNLEESGYTTEYIDQFESVLNKLKVKQGQYRTEKGFLKHLFYNVHRKLLGEYDQYSAFTEIFDKDRSYDCVTASILYALIFEQLGIQYEVRETDYHVYVLAYADGQEIFLETTDPLYGFVTDQDEVTYRKNFYSGNIPESPKDEMTGLAAEDPRYQNSGHVDNAVVFSKLPALQYYNQAIRQFNAGNISSAHKLIKKAQAIHPTDRINNTASYIFSIAFEY